MPHRHKFLDPKQKRTLIEAEKQLPNLLFEVYSDALLVLRPSPKLCISYPLGYLHWDSDSLVSEIIKHTQLRH